MTSGEYKSKFAHGETCTLSQWERIECWPFFNFRCHL